jgi:hypothetical protein
MLFKALFGQLAVLALLPVHMQGPEQNRLNPIPASLAVISRPQHNVHFIDFVRQIYTKAFDVRTEAHGRFEVTHFELESGLTVFYALADDLLIVTLDSGTIKQCLDLAQSQGACLAAESGFQDLRAQLHTADSRRFVYADIPGIHRNLMPILQAFAGSDQRLEVMQRFGNANRGLGALAYVSDDPGGGLLRDKIVLKIDKGAMDPVYARLYSVQPAAGKTLKMAPGQTLLYGWLNALDLRSRLDIYRQQAMLDEKALKAADVRLKAETGIGLDRLLQSFGRQFGLILTDVNTGGLFPVPKLALCAEMAQPEVVAKLMARLAGKAPVPLRQEQFEGITLHYLVLPLGNDLQPAYAFVDGFCVVAMNPQLIKQMIASRKGANLAADSEFQSVDKGLSDANNQVYFIRTDQLMAKLNEIVSWATRMLAFKDPEKARKARIVADGLIHPLLNGLTFFQSIGYRAVIREAAVEADVIYRINR